MTCRVCGGTVQITHTEELAPEIVRRRTLCVGCGRKSVRLDLEMCDVARVPQHVVGKILEGLEPASILKSYHRTP